jgi:hypothetical protein
VIDNGSWNNYNDTFTVSTAGNHTIEFYSSDNAGNIEDVRSIWVDNGNNGGDDGTGANTQGLPQELVILGVVIAIAVIAVSILAYARYRKKSKNGGRFPPPPSD